MKRLTLLIGAASAPSPHLARLLARGRAETAVAIPGLSAALARLFGVDCRDLAALALAGEGIAPGTAAWFRADPVHLLAGMHSLTLFDSRQTAPRADEAAALVAALNRHFAGEIEFLAPHPARWYARFQNPPEVEVPPLDEVAGGSVPLDLVAGPDARALQRAAMEAQMLLHAHPVSQAREAAGAPTLNALWFWGGGSWRRPVTQLTRVYGDDHLARSLAAAAGIPAAALPERFDAGLLEDDTLVVLPDLDDGAERAWLRPLLAALRRRRLTELSLLQVGRPPSRLDPWRALAFWR
ncbi:MAG: hypothetical protein PHS77_11350 [Gallionellaceae bacterium]|nr:hypothetical protein [Gallionellaceae bacterium]